MPTSEPTTGTCTGRPAVDYETARSTDTELYAALFHALLERGVAMAPGPYEVAFPGLAHTDDVIDEVVATAAAAALEVAKHREGR